MQPPSFSISCDTSVTRAALLRFTLRQICPTFSWCAAHRGQSKCIVCGEAEIVFITSELFPSSYMPLPQSHKLAEPAAHRLVYHAGFNRSTLQHGAAIRQRPPRWGPGVSHTGATLDLRTRRPPSQHVGPRDDGERRVFTPWRTTGHALPRGVIQPRVWLHYHFKMENYLSELYWERASPALPHPQSQRVLPLNT